MADSSPRSPATRPTAPQGDAPGQPKPPGHPPAKEDGPLESLGKAITDPVRTAADDDEADTR